MAEKLRIATVSGVQVPSYFRATHEGLSDAALAIAYAFHLPSNHLCKYRPTLMAGDDCVNCGRPYADHKS